MISPKLPAVLFCVPASFLADAWLQPLYACSVSIALQLTSAAQPSPAICAVLDPCFVMAGEGWAAGDQGGPELPGSQAPAAAALLPPHHVLPPPQGAQLLKLHADVALCMPLSLAPASTCVQGRSGTQKRNPYLFRLISQDLDLLAS